MDTILLPNDILLGQITDMLANGVSVVLRVKGNSMLPFIVGDKDSVELYKCGSVSENDMVLAHLKNDNYVLHRVIGIEGNHVTLMGDGNIRGTEHCTLDDICGTVLYILKYKGKKIDCHSSGFLKKSARWRKLLPFRRYILGIYRRLAIR